MDIQDLISKLMAGSNPILLLIVFLLFKDQILAIFTPRPPAPPPAPPPVPPPVPLPGPTPVVVDDRPVVDAIVKIIPALLPLIAELLKQQASEKPDSNT